MPFLRIFPVLGDGTMAFALTMLVALVMILGRLEMLSFLVLFTPGFWRK